MKTKHLITISLVLALLTFTFHADAQKIYSKISSGYNLALGGQTLFYFDFVDNTSRNHAITYDQVFVSLGQGLNFSLAGGYRFNENLACELDISWLRGDKQKAEHKYQEGNTTCYLTPDMVQVIPSLVISTQVKKMYPYMKFGALFGTGWIDYTRFVDNNNHSEIKTWRLDGGLAVGVSTAAGVMIKLGEKLSLSGEVIMKNLNYAPTNGALIRAEYDKVDVLSNLSVAEKEIEYVSQYSIDENMLADPSQPDEQLKQRLPFGSFGLNFGLVYSF